MQVTLTHAGVIHELFVLIPGEFFQLFPVNGKCGCIETRCLIVGCTSSNFMALGLILAVSRAADSRTRKICSRTQA